MYDKIFLLEDNDKKLIALGEESSVQGNINLCNSFFEEHKGEYIFGFLSYDLKNQIEVLKSENTAIIEFPELYFVVPQYVIEIKEDQTNFLKGDTNAEIDAIISKFSHHGPTSGFDQIELQSSITKEQYLDNVRKLQEHIQYGDIYEITFCQEFFARDVSIDPFQVYANLSELTQAPFSCFVQYDTSFLLSGSPERFICKKAGRISSEPIKGTARRSDNRGEDEQNKKRLINSPKEKAENVMIVDLVRNDLSKIAKRNTVKVDELFGVYSFNTVHQLISTISAELKQDVSFDSILRAMFPMGSMTGAPKISAMKLIEKYEAFKRGLFSGSVGYISPAGDFDFNVIIRSILYDETKKYISCPVGGAITIQSDPEEEYEECLLKVEALKKALE
jgi:para-aminobenzoate synthetase component 1